MVNTLHTDRDLFDLPATRRRNRTDKRAINHFSGFKKNTHAHKKKRHTSTASLYHIYSERGRRFVTSGTG